MMIRSDESVLELNISEFFGRAEYFTGSTSAKDQFSYGPFWDAVVADNYNGEIINIFTGNKQKRDGSFYYEYGLLKAEEEMEAEHLVTELRLDGLYSYNIYYENPDEQPVSFYFYTKTRIAAFVQHENEVMNLAAEMREITQQKPILCLESHKRLFRIVLLIPYCRLTRMVNTATKICGKNTVRMLPRFTQIGCGINSDVLTSMKLICLWLEMWK